MTPTKQTKPEQVFLYVSAVLFMFVIMYLLRPEFIQGMR